MPNRTPTDKHTLQKLFPNKNTIVTGDFNSYNPIWSINLDRPKDKLGELLEIIMIENQYVNMNTGQHTYQRNNGGTSCLDLTFCSNNISNKCHWTTHNNTLGSDHIPTIITYNKPIDKDDTTIKSWILNKADWESFNITTGKIFSKNTQINFNPITKQTISNQTQSITNNIIKAANSTIPIFQANNTRVKTIPYWSKKLTKQTTDRNNARTTMNRTNNIDDYIHYNQLKGTTQYNIKEAAKNYWIDYCNSLNSATKLGEVWKESKKMNQITDNSNYIPNLKTNNNTTTSTTQEKTEILADQFEFNSSNQNYSNTFTNNITKHLSNPSFAADNSTQKQQTNELNHPITLTELQTAIATSEQKSSPGPDTITYSMLKNLSHIALLNILDLYNNIFNTGKMPDTWKHSIITPIPKPEKDKTIPASYRPISQTNTLCKILERIITNRIQYFLETNNKFNKYQTGFRKELSTTDQLIKLQTEITKALRHKGLTLAVFLDFEKAYDMVWRPGLLHKCIKLGLNGKIFNYIKTFISNRTFQVKINNTLSTTRTQINGTPQGSVISSLLFLIMINDLSPASENIQMSLYADDSATYTSGKNKKTMFISMQKTLNKISAWCDEWGFKLSPTKSTCVIFSREIKYKNLDQKLFINNQEIKIERKVKFLGMIIDNKLNFNEHINYIIDRCNKRLNLMRNLCGTTWGASISTLLVIYKTLIRSVIEYGEIIYINTSITNKNKLNSLQYQALKICCGAAAGSPLVALQNETGEIPLELNREKQQLIYYAKVKSNPKHPSQNSIHYPPNIKYYDKPGLNLIAMDTDPIFKQHNWTVNTNNNTGITPWLHNKIITNETLLHIFTTPHTTTKKLEISNRLINSYHDSIHIYTDGTLQLDHKSASGFHIPTLNNITTNRNTDRTPIITSELIAIQNAIEYIATNTNITNIAIFTDSTETIKRINLDPLKLTIKTSQIANNIKQLAATYKHITIHLVWIPSHIGIVGNETIDQHTKTATAKQININSPSDLTDIKHKIDTYIIDKWQTQYNSTPKGKTYKMYEPIVNTEIKALTKTKRTYQRKITRLKIGRCNLNYFQHQYGLHCNGMCTYCNTIENIEHHIIHCPKYNYITHLQHTLTTLQLTPTLHNILTNSSLSQELAQLIKRVI